LWREAKINFKLWESQSKKKALEITVEARIHMLWWGTCMLNIPTDPDLSNSQDSSLNKGTGSRMNDQVSFLLKGKDFDFRLHL
jgi:hypothetical protein